FRIITVATLSANNFTSARSAEIKVTDEDGLARMITVTQKGYSQKLLDISPEKEFNFGKIELGMHKEESIVLENKGNSTVSIAKIELSGDAENQFSITEPFYPNQNFEIPAGKSEEIKIRFSPTSQGTKTAKLVIHNNSNNEGPLKEIALKGGEDTYKEIQLTNVNEGMFYIGTVEWKEDPINKAFAIKNTGNGILTIYDIIIEDDNLDDSKTDVTDYSIVEPKDLSFQLLPGDSVQVVVKFEPQAREYKTRVVRIRILNDSDNAPELFFTTQGTEADYLQQNKLKIYPNPLYDYLNIEFNTIPKDYQISMHNSLGQVILQKQSSKRLEQLNLENVTSGIYYLKIYNNDFSKTEKLIVK
ncbi:MAG: choice-of-anchor D domain-containing protein, partial [Prolixibacteraceae bacterium]